MRVFNRKKKVWVELPDPEPTAQEEWDMEYRKFVSSLSMARHDNMPEQYRKETWERGH